MPRIININALETCDIILTTSTAFESKAIRFGTKADISHAMICVAHGSVIDSTGEGVHARNVQKLFYDDSCAIHIIRLKRPLQNEEKKQIIDYVRATIGTPYSVKEALTSVVRPKSEGSDFQFCSRLAARAFKQIDINISENPDYCTPAQIKNSPLFVEVPNPFITISESEKEFIESRGTTLDEMRDITNKLLDLAKEAVPHVSILNINDIIVALQNDTSLDAKFSQAFKESGYLDHWKSEVTKYPWRYNKIAMDQFLKEKPELLEDLINYCIITIKDHQASVFNHWQNNFLKYSIASKQQNLLTLSLNAELYKNLWEHHKKRVETAAAFLKEHHSAN